MINIYVEIAGIPTDLYISNDLYEEACTRTYRDAPIFDEENMTSFLYSLFKEYYDDTSQFHQYIQRHRAQLGVPKHAIIHAHGVDGSPEWMIQDGDITSPVHAMLEVIDGEYGTVLITACNPQHHTLPKLRQSLLVYSDRAVQAGRLCEDTAYILTLHTPDGKEIDAYTIDYELMRQSS